MGKLYFSGRLAARARRPETPLGADLPPGIAGEMAPEACAPNARMRSQASGPNARARLAKRSTSWTTLSPARRSSVHNLYI